MSQNKTDTGLYLDVHSLVRIYAPILPSVVKNYLLDYLGLFEVSEHWQPADILVLTLPENRHISLPDSTIYNFWLIEYQGEQGIAFSYRGEAVIAVVFSECLKIFFRPEKKIAEKLYTILLYCIHLILKSKNSLLFHGAMAVSDDKKNAIILTGPRGSKKSLLLLSLLKEGWNYISDDKFILSNKTAYIFQDFSILCEHHIDSLPWLLELNPAVAKLKSGKNLRNAIKKLATRSLPSYLLPPLQQYYDKSLKFSIDSLFTDITILSRVNPKTVIILTFGLNFEIKSVTVSEIINEITTIQDLSFYHFYRFEKILSLINSAYTINLQAILVSNLADQTFFKLTIPYNYDIEQVYKELKQCIKSAS